jgi:hypothetical protein
LTFFHITRPNMRCGRVAAPSLPGAICVRTHICPKRQAAPDRVDRRRRNSKVKRGRPGGECSKQLASLRERRSEGSHFGWGGIRRRAATGTACRLSPCDPVAQRNDNHGSMTTLSEAQRLPPPPGSSASCALATLEPVRDFLAGLPGVIYRDLGGFLRPLGDVLARVLGGVIGQLESLDRPIGSLDRDRLAASIDV